MPKRISTSVVENQALRDLLDAMIADINTLKDELASRFKVYTFDSAVVVNNVAAGGRIGGVSIAGAQLGGGVLDANDRILVWGDAIDKILWTGEVNSGAAEIWGYNITGALLTLAGARTLYVLVIRDPTTATATPPGGGTGPASNATPTVR